jgi:hypothetical protein
MIMAAAVALMPAMTGYLAAEAGSREPRTADADAAIETIRAWFDAHADQPRAIALLSPT